LLFLILEWVDFPKSKLKMFGKKLILPFSEIGSAEAQEASK
jgi:hypothetical protein